MAASALTEEFRSKILQLHKTWQPTCQELTREGIGIPADSWQEGFTVPRVLPQHLGSRRFCEEHGLKYPYMGGAMAGAISSVEMVVALGKAGMLGSFGAGGLALDEIERSILKIKEVLGENQPFAVNLIHNPHDPAWEENLVSLLLKHRVRQVEASAYIKVGPPLVRYRVKGLYRNADGQVVAPNRVIAKLSRTEVAAQFCVPADAKLLAALLSSGEITPHEAELAREIPLADDITVEADSGGHTDNRPAFAIFPAVAALCERMHELHPQVGMPRIGLGGGIATPHSVAAAFAMGAAYIVTGSVNQSCVEAGSSPAVKQLLATAGAADVAMAPSANMFEIGAKVQVLRRGTMFPMRAAKLYEIYNKYGSIDEIPTEERGQLENTIFRQSLDLVWQNTKDFFEVRDRSQLARADAAPRYKMALIFRSYLGQASRWAAQGVADRKMDYQIWCGPAMGAFNEWSKGSWLEDAASRRVVPVALNLLVGAAINARLQAFRHAGFTVPGAEMLLRPLSPDDLQQIISHSES
jgi:PfaD family protein